MTKASISKISTREQQRIKKLARLKAAGLIQAALDEGSAVGNLVEHGLSEQDAQLVERELAQLAKRLES